MKVSTKHRIVVSVVVAIASVGFLFVAFGVYLGVAMTVSVWEMNRECPRTPDDPRLASEAARLKPIIVKLDDYRKHYGRNPDDLLPLGVSGIEHPFPDSKGSDFYRFTKVTGVREFYYVREESGYRLCLKLGWDPALCYVCESNESYWVFDPGDGSPEKRIEF